MIWQKRGALPMKGKTYSRQRHINAVLRCYRGKVRSRAILETMCRLSEFDRPEVIITKPQLVEETGRCWNTVKSALAELREAGSILPVKNQLGGRGNAVTWRLVALAAEDTAPAPDLPADDTGAELWAVVAARYSAKDAANYRQWVAPLQFDGLSGGVLRLVAMSDFKASYCKTHISNDLEKIANEVQPGAALRIKIAAA